MAGGSAKGGGGKISSGVGKVNKSTYESSTPGVKRSNATRKNWFARKSIGRGKLSV